MAKKPPMLVHTSLKNFISNGGLSGNDKIVIGELVITFKKMKFSYKISKNKQQLTDLVNYLGYNNIHEIDQCVSETMALYAVPFHPFNFLHPNRRNKIGDQEIDSLPENWFFRDNVRIIDFYRRYENRLVAETSETLFID